MFQFDFKAVRVYLACHHPYSFLTLKSLCIRYKLVNMRNVTVTKEPEECFGFVIHSSLRAEDTFKIGQVVADSPAGRCPDLMEGDSVLTVNGK